jgi:hypothetical protein
MKRSPNSEATKRWTCAEIEGVSEERFRAMTAIQNVQPLETSGMRASGRMERMMHISSNGLVVNDETRSPISFEGAVESKTGRHFSSWLRKTLSSKPSNPGTVSRRSKSPQLEITIWVNKKSSGRSEYI